MPSNEIKFMQESFEADSDVTAGQSRFIPAFKNKVTGEIVKMTHGFHDVEEVIEKANLEHNSYDVFDQWDDGFYDNDTNTFLDRKETGAEILKLRRTLYEQMTFESLFGKIPEKPRHKKFMVTFKHGKRKVYHTQHPVTHDDFIKTLPTSEYSQTLHIEPLSESLVEKISEQILNEICRKIGKKKYRLYSHSGKNLGT